MVPFSGPETNHAWIRTIQTRTRSNPSVALSTTLSIEYSIEQKMLVSAPWRVVVGNMERAHKRSSSIVPTSATTTVEPTCMVDAACVEREIA